MSAPVKRVQGFLRVVLVELDCYIKDHSAEVPEYVYTADAVAVLVTALGTEWEARRRIIESHDHVVAEEQAQLYALAEGVELVNYGKEPL